MRTIRPKTSSKGYVRQSPKAKWTSLSKSLRSSANVACSQ